MQESVCQRRPLGSDPLAGRDVDGVRGGVVADSQAQVSDGAGAVLLHQDVLGLQIPVSDARFSYVGIRV